MRAHLAARKNDFCVWQRPPAFASRSLISLPSHLCYLSRSIRSGATRPVIRHARMFSPNVTGEACAARTLSSKFSACWKTRSRDLGESGWRYFTPSPTLRWIFYAFTFLRSVNFTSCKYLRTNSSLIRRIEKTCSLYPRVVFELLRENWTNRVESFWIVMTESSKESTSQVWTFEGNIFTVVIRLGIFVHL